MESSKKESSTVIRNFHGMPWLKKHSPSNDDKQRAVGPDGEVLSMKKTDEDYFPGTRDEKRVKKKKVKKGKTVWTLDTLEDLMSPALASPDLEEEPNTCSYSSHSDENSSQTTAPGATMWSKDKSTADKLFPNVQSVVIDRNDEAEMLTEALVESVATLQLEAFKKSTILEENQWEPLDDEDEGGWENVRRNLPSPLKHEPLSSNGENNTSPKPGILRNKQNNFNRCFTDPESLDFGFRRLSESLKEEIQAGRSLKSVSFSETLLAKDPSGMSGNNDELEKIVDGNKGREPNIDKYGRVDGYSERRLFMGKGARMKELQYIQSKTNVAAQDNKQPESEALVAMQPLQDVLKLEERLTTGVEEPLTTAVEEPTNSVDNPEKPLTEVETPSTVLENREVENPEKPTAEIENLRLEKTEQPTAEIENLRLEKTEQPTAEIEIPRLEETEQPTSGGEQQEKLEVLTTGAENREPKEPEKAAIAVGIGPTDRMPEMENQEAQQPEPAIIPRNDTLAIMEETLVTLPPVQDVHELEEEPTIAVGTPRVTESEMPTSGVEVAEKPTNGTRIPESTEPEIATIPKHQTHRIMETKVIIPPAPVQDICQLTGMPMRKVKTSENQTPNPLRELDSDVHLIIKPGVQDVRYMKKDPTMVVKEPDRRRPEESQMRMGRPKPRKLEKSDKLKTGVENQPEKSRELRDLDKNRNSIKRQNKSNIEASLWSNSKESSVSLQSETTAPETTESKVKNMRAKHETAREEPVTKFVIVINNRRVEMVSCGTQTEGSLRDLQKENVPTEKISEKKSDFVGRCLVPTLVRDDTTEKDSTLDLETLVAMDVMPEPQFQSAAWRNLLLTGAFQDASYEAQNSHINAQYLQNQNNLVPNSIPLNSMTIPYQTFNNGMQMPMPNYSPILPNYLNGNPQFPQTGCSYMFVSLPNLPNQNGDGSGNLNNVVYKPVERREDLLERENNNYAAYQLQSELERQALGAVAPGFVKSSQLPPGFTKKEKKTDNDELGIDSSESNLKNVQNTKDEIHQEEDSPSRSTGNRRGARKQNNRKRPQKNRTRDVRESEPGSDPQDRKRKPYSQTRMEYQQRQNLWHARKLAELKARQNYGSQKDTTENKSLILDENSNSHGSNDNYLTESVNSPVDRQANSPQSEKPVVYQIPNQQSPGIGPASNWQYHANVMNPAQIPVNMIPGYQYLPVIPNPQTLALGSYNPMTYQQLPAQLLNPIQAAQNSAFDFSPQNGFPSINNHSVEMVQAEIPRSKQYSAAGNNDLNQIPTESVHKAPKGRGRGRPIQNDLV